MRPAPPPATVELPFNRHALAGRFRPGVPGADPGGDGWSLALRGTRLLVGEGSPPVLPEHRVMPPAALFLGWLDDRPCRAWLLAEEFEPLPGTTLRDLLAADPGLPLALLSLAGIAVQALHWAQRSRLCGECGTPAAWMPHDWGRRCPACAATHYPAIHPCVIVLISAGERLLLVRKPAWAPNRYSLVAGFVDFGESLEEAVIREAREETGLEVGDVRYVGSQNWPFPSQLMAGFTARCRGGELRVDRTELADARWFGPGELPQLPPPRSIARFLIDRWLAEQRGSP